MAFYKKLATLNHATALLATSLLAPHGEARSTDRLAAPQPTTKAPPKGTARKHSSTLPPSPSPSLPPPQAEHIHVNGATALAQHMQHTPTSLIHLDRTALLRAHVTTVNDLQHIVPNLQIENAFGGGQPQFHLRGVGFFDYGSNNTPDVMTYIDGVAYPLGIMTQSAMFDLASVDVERGPSGYMSGRNVTGGAIEMHSTAPTTHLTAGISEDFANHTRSKTDFYVSNAITPHLTYRLSGETLQGGAYMRNRQTGQSIGNAHIGALRGTLRWEIDDSSTITLTGHWGLDRSQSTPGYLLTPLTMPDGTRLPADTSRYVTGWGMSRAFTDYLHIAPNSKPFRNTQSWGVDLTYQKELSWARLSSISAYETMYRRELNDWDGTQAADADVYFDSQLSLFSQEVRLASHTHGPFEWNIGVYYFKEALTDAMYSDFVDVFGFYQKTHYSQPDQSVSEFATLSYHPISPLRISVSLRHENEWKTLSQFYTQRSTRTIAAPRYDRATGMDQLSGRFALEYDIQTHITSYFTVRRGVKEGGFSAYNLSSPSQLTPFKPEWLLAYELGLKSAFWNQRLQLNGAVFHYDYHDQQVQSAIEDPTIGAIGKIVNAPHASLWGAEVTLQLHPWRTLHMRQDIGYERGQYTMFQALDISASQATGAHGGGYKTINTNMQGRDMGFPKLQLSGSASYDISLAGILQGYTLSPEVNYSYRSAQTAVILGPLYNIKPYFLLNTSLTFQPHRGRWSVTAYVQNALNKSYDLTRNFFTSSHFGIAGAPRFYGVRLSYNY